MFLSRKHKAKNSTIIYYVYFMDHEIISYKTLIQELSVQYTIVLHYHTKIGKFMCQFTTFRQPASIAQSLIVKNLWMNKSFLPWLRNTHRHVQYVCGCMCAPTNVKNDSQTIPFAYISAGCPLDLTCIELIIVKTSVACETTDCELINK